MEIANFFWHGVLSQVEEACIKSFIKHGFKVYVWSYTNIKVDGAESRDAHEIFPKDDLFKYNQAYGNKTIEHSSLAVFSDIFRYKVLEIIGGWWFDTDCYCLKDQSEFTELRRNKKIVFGFEDELTCIANSAVLWADSEVLTELNNRTNTIIKEKNYTMDAWGELGPLLVTQVCIDMNIIDNLLPIDKFYSISWRELDLYLDANKKQRAKSLIANSYVSHIWTSIWTEYKLDKKNLPENSLIDEFINFTYTNTELHSSEASDKHYSRVNDIANLYKTILKRNPDSGGWSSYLNGRLSIDQIRNDMMNSTEYKNLHK